MSGFTKIIDLPEDAFKKENESRVTPFVHTNLGFELDDRRTKTAACDDALKFAFGIEPREDRRVILVSAMGAMEAWGDNKKGDAFPLASLHGEYPTDVTPEFFAKYASRIPEKWGIQCYPTVRDEQGRQIGGGNTFHEHINRVAKDVNGFYGCDGMAKGAGLYSGFSRFDPRCGDVLGAFFNPERYRVELVIEVRKDKLPKAVMKIDRGEKLGVSMACDVPFDRCMICGNLAPTPRDYCEHLNSSKYPRGTILDHGLYGVIAAMINDFCQLFDISIVDSPAAIEGRMLQKIASAKYYQMNGGLYVPEGINQKSAAVTVQVRKAPKPQVNRSRLPVIQKLQVMRLNEQPFSKRVVVRLRAVPLKRLLGYLAVLGMMPTFCDLANLMFDMPEKQASEIGHEAETHFLPLMLSGHRIDVEDTNTIVKYSSSDQDFIKSEFNDVLDIVEDYIPWKCYYPEYLSVRPEGYVKSAKTEDYTGNFSALSNEAKALLLARVFMEPALIPVMTRLFKTPFIQYQLQKLGIVPAQPVELNKTLPIYGDLATSYIGSLSNFSNEMYKKRASKTPALDLIKRSLEAGSKKKDHSAVAGDQIYKLEKAISGMHEGTTSVAQLAINKGIDTGVLNTSSVMTILPEKEK